MASMFLGVAPPAKHVAFVKGVVSRQAAFDVVAVMHLKNDVQSGAKAMGALTAMQFDLLGAVCLPFLLPIKLHHSPPTRLAEGRVYLIDGSFAMHFGIVAATAGQDTTVT